MMQPSLAATLVENRQDYLQKLGISLKQRVKRLVGPESDVPPVAAGAGRLNGCKHLGSNFPPTLVRRLEKAVNDSLVASGRPPQVALSL